MSMVRAKLEHKTILDFSKGKVSRNRIRQSLRKVDVIEKVNIKNGLMFRENWINVGLFRVNIIPYSVSTEPRKRLREYGAFAINIQEALNNKGNHWRLVHPDSDVRFRGQSWAPLMGTYKVRIKHLIDIIYYLSKINKMRAFL